MTHLAAILGVLIISFSAIFVRLAGVSPDTAAVFRTLYAVPVLLALWFAFGRSSGSPARSGKLMAIALASGIFLGLELAVWHRAIEWIGAGLATVLGNTQVIFVGLAAWFLHGERPRRSMFVGIPLAFVGMTLVSGLGRADAYGENPLLGTLFGLLTGVTYAFFLLLFRRSTRHDSTPFAAFSVATLGAFLAAAAIGGLDGDLDLAWSWPAHGWLIALALGSQVAGWLLIAYALPRLPAAETSILLLLQPMATVLWALFLFGEDLSVIQWLGVALILTGVALPSAGPALRSTRRALG
jgi:drug/metabolite transporter (DMT)-like permease